MIYKFRKQGDSMNQIERVFDILLTYSLAEPTVPKGQIPLLQKIRGKVDKNEELIFILPAFPAKSPCREKTAGELPDYGEVLALKNLQDLCQKICCVYEAGARIIICSDGRIFSDVVLVSDESIDRYNAGVLNIIQEFNLDRLSLFRMDDLYPLMRPEDLREVLLKKYASSIADVKAQVIRDEDYRHLFNGIHRFLFEDFRLLESSSSRSYIHKKSKEKSYELIRRSEAWSRFLNEHFNNHLRLSIHPHSLENEKFGVKLVPGSSKWATPWHNVAVKMKDRFELMHKSEALKLNAKIKRERDQYVYFEVPAF